jgi:hypothetical protein
MCVDKLLNYRKYEITDVLKQFFVGLMKQNPSNQIQNLSLNCSGFFANNFNYIFETEQKLLEDIQLLS